MKRISLLLHNPYVDNGGYKIDCYNQTTADWTNCGNANYTAYPTGWTTNKFYQHYAVLKPRDGFTKFNEYVSDGYIYFRMRNSIPNTAFMQFQINYVELLIDGFPVSLTNQMALNFRDSFTGTGYTGK